MNQEISSLSEKRIEPGDLFPQFPIGRAACLICDTMVVARRLPVGRQVEFYICDCDQELILAYMRADDAVKEALR